MKHCSSAANLVRGLSIPHILLGVIILNCPDLSTLFSPNLNIRDSRSAVKSEMLVERVCRFALRHKLFEPGPVLVAVSGRADSLTLLHILMTLRDTFDITLHAATFDHDTRGAVGAHAVEA